MHAVMGRCQQCCCCDARAHALPPLAWLPHEVCTNTTQELSSGVCLPMCGAGRTRNTTTLACDTFDYKLVEFHDAAVSTSFGDWRYGQVVNIINSHWKEAWFNDYGKPRGYTGTTQVNWPPDQYLPSWFVVFKADDFGHRGAVEKDDIVVIYSYYATMYCASTCGVFSFNELQCTDPSPFSGDDQYTIPKRLQHVVEQCLDGTICFKSTHCEKYLTVAMNAVIPRASSPSTWEQHQVQVFGEPTDMRLPAKFALKYGDKLCGAQANPDYALLCNFNFDLTNPSVRFTAKAYGGASVRITPGMDRDMWEVREWSLQTEASKLCSVRWLQPPNAFRGYIYCEIDTFNTWEHIVIHPGMEGRVFLRSPTSTLNWGRWCTVLPSAYVYCDQKPDAVKPQATFELIDLSDDTCYNGRGSSPPTLPYRALNIDTVFRGTESIDVYIQAGDGTDAGLDATLLYKFIVTRADGTLVKDLLSDAKNTECTQDDKENGSPPQLCARILGVPNNAAHIVRVEVYKAGIILDDVVPEPYHVWPTEDESNDPLLVPDGGPRRRGLLSHGSLATDVRRRAVIDFINNRLNSREMMDIIRNDQIASGERPMNDGGRLDWDLWRDIGYITPANVESALNDMYYDGLRLPGTNGRARADWYAAIGRVEGIEWQGGIPTATARQWLLNNVVNNARARFIPGPMFQQGLQRIDPRSSGQGGRVRNDINAILNWRQRDTNAFARRNGIPEMFNAEHMQAFGSYYLCMMNWNCGRK